MKKKNQNIQEQLVTLKKYSTHCYHKEISEYQKEKKERSRGKERKKWLVLSPQFCPILCDPMDFSLPSSPAHGILQASILEWLAIPFPGNPSQSGIEPGYPALQSDSLLSKQWKFSSISNTKPLMQEAQRIQSKVK